MSVEAFNAWKIAFDKEMSEKAHAEALKNKSVNIMTEEEKIEYYAKVRVVEWWFVVTVFQ